MINYCIWCFCFFFHQTSGMCGRVCTCDCTHHMEKTAWMGGRERGGSKRPTFMVHMCKMIISVSFIFCKILIFQVVREVKGQKTVQNDKKSCLSCFIFQEPYMIWLSFMVQMCKMIISPGIILVFSKFWFSGL